MRMKAIRGLLIAALFSFSAHAQEIKNDSVPYHLTNAEWNKVNDVWCSKSKMVCVQTSDSIIHRGQIIVANDSTLLLYESDAMFDPAKQDSFARCYATQDVIQIFHLEPKHRFKTNARWGCWGAAIGTAIGTSLHLFVPGKKFHPVFIAPISGIGLLSGLANAPRNNSDNAMDTVWIMTQAELKDTAAGNELVWATYDYTVFSDRLPDSVTWTMGQLKVTSQLTFDDLASSSRRINRVFTPTKFYASVSSKATFGKYDNQFSGNELLLFNIGYRVAPRWSVDIYYGSSRSLVQLNSTSGLTATMKSRNSALTCSYALLPHDRVNLKRAQCYAGVGLAYSLVDIYEASPGLSLLSAESYGFVCKMDLAIFLSRRIALIADVQQTFLDPVTLPSFDWTQQNGIITVPSEVITTSNFQIGLGLRIHL